MITCYLAVSIVVIWCIYHYLLLQYNSIDAWHFLSPFFNVNVHCTANFRSHTPQTQVSRILCSECMKKCWFEANNVLEGKVYWTELKSKREMVQKTGGRRNEKKWLGGEGRRKGEIFLWRPVIVWSAWCCDTGSAWCCDTGGWGVLEVLSQYN